MQPRPGATSFGSSTGKHVKGNVLVPVDACNGQLDVAEEGTPSFGVASQLKGERLDGRPPLLSSGGNELSLDQLTPDPSVSQTKSGLADTSVSYGKQQDRLMAQLAARQRRSSHLHESLRVDGEDIAAEEAGPWAVLKKDLQTSTWRAQWKRRFHRLSHSLVVRPGSPRLQKWFFVCVVMALVSGWETPFHFAFLEPGGLLKPYTDWVAVVEYISTAIFALDFLLKFSVMYIDPDSGLLVGSRKKIARRYVTSWKFYLDLIGWLPLDWIVIDTAAAMGASERVLVWLAWIKQLTLVRMYRVFELFADLDYRMVLSQGTLMLTRNYTYVFFITHWAACILYHIGSHQNFSPNSWVGRNAERFMGRPAYEKYLLSLYFSTSAFTGLGDAALFASTVPEAAFMVVYLLFNLFLGAYILGTVTMLVVKGDERSKAFRERMSNLNEFSENNDLPERLQSAMQEHLEVTFNTEQIDDEHVLGIYPTTVRRKVLRHLYLHPVRSCYLFKGCKQRFLDALLTVARVELFMPGVQLLTEGDNVTELNIIVSGDVLVAEAGIKLSAAFSQFASVDPSNRSTRRRSVSGDPGGSVRGSMVISGGSGLGRTSSAGYNSSVGRNSSCNGSVTDFLIDGTNGFMEMATGKKVVTRYSGDALADVPFFTDVPSNETIMSQSVVRVLSIPKAAWEELMDLYPQQARMVLTNLQVRTETALSHELQNAADLTQLTEEQLRAALQYGKDRHKAMFKDAPPPIDLTEILPQNTIDFLHRLDDVRAIVRAHVRKVDQLRTFEFLGCASDGDIETLRTMLNQGMNPNSADYDGRTGLMLAASGGHEALVRLLLDSGAKSDQLDAFGNSAMCEAVKNAHDNVIDVLLSYGATLGMDPMAVASVMCTAVYEGDLIKLRRLLRSGAPPDACDYDKRSALHIAGAEGNLAAVKLLVEEGGADPNFQDRWGNTALDEARRVGATPVVAYLEDLLGADKLVGSGVQYRQKVATDFLSACSTGDVARVRYITHNSHPGCIFTGLVLAASKGFKDIAELLLAWIPSDLLFSAGHLALVVAARMGHSAVVAALRSNGVRLPEPRDTVLLAHMRTAVMSVDLRAVAALLAAGLDVGAAENAALLHSAASRGSLELVRRLVEQGGMRPNAEDSAGKTPAAVAEAAKLTAIAEYLRWAASIATSAAATATATAAPQGLAEAAATRFGPLPEYSSRDTHDELSHGVTAPDALSNTDEDDEPPPMLLARLGSLSSVSSSRRLISMGSMSRQTSLRRVGGGGGGGAAAVNSLWKLSSMARMAANTQPEDPESSHLESGQSFTSNKPRRARRSSLTNFLSGHRADGITVNPVEVDLATLLAGPTSSGPSTSLKNPSKVSSTGFVLSAGSNVSGGAATSSGDRRRSSATGGGLSGLNTELTEGGRRRSSTTGGELSRFITDLVDLAVLNTEAGLAKSAPLAKNVEAVVVRQGSFLVAGQGMSQHVAAPMATVVAAAAAPLLHSQGPGPPPVAPPGPFGAPLAAPVTSAAVSPPQPSAAAGGGGELSFGPPTPGDGSTEGGDDPLRTVGSSCRRPSTSTPAVPPVREDALESFLRVAPSVFSSSRVPAKAKSAAQPPPPPPGSDRSFAGGGDGSSGVGSGGRAGAEGNDPEGGAGLGSARDMYSGALANGDWSHRALEKRLTALCPPDR